MTNTTIPCPYHNCPGAIDPATLHGEGGHRYAACDTCKRNARIATHRHLDGSVGYTAAVSGKARQNRAWLGVTVSAENSAFVRSFPNMSEAVDEALTAFRKLVIDNGIDGMIK